MTELRKRWNLGVYSFSASLGWFKIYSPEWYRRWRALNFYFLMIVSVFLMVSGALQWLRGEWLSGAALWICALLLAGLTLRLARRPE
ncbi:MAG TPA: hypothetical protein VK881_10225 [bacterium]|nr:hypothetical protein [bacterium]